MTTPMFEQYYALKGKQPDALLLFRMGDFYELFFDDAVVAAPILDIVLTSRNPNDANPIPMAGVPHHSVGAYIEKLTEAGHRVAIAEQVEDPAKAKGLVKRDIVRVVTPGVTFDPTALAADRRPWLVAVGPRLASGFGVSFLDVSTGDLRLTTVSQLAHVVAELERMEPREALLGPDVDLQTLKQPLKGVTNQRGRRDHMDRRRGASRAARGPRRRVIGGIWSSRRRPGTAARGGGRALRPHPNGGRLGNVHRLRPYRTDGFMVVDETTRRNLEITRTLMGGSRRGSLLGLIDRTCTSMGSRRLADWLAFPLLEPTAIAARQACIAALVDAPGVRNALRERLSEVADVERIAARVAQGTAHARDLAALQRSLAAIPALVSALGDVDALNAYHPADVCSDVQGDLGAWLVEEPPQSVTEGGLIRPEADPELAALTALALNAVGVISELEDKERKATQIPSLKIKRNRVFGYFLEVTSAHLHKVPSRFLRKQTLSSCERYITPELKELEEKVLGADERRKELEYERFKELRERVSTASARLIALAGALAELDVLATLAEVAVQGRWVRPTLDGGLTLRIEGGRHPMVEAALDEERFVPNDIALDVETRRLVVLTGANMSGKSTVLRLTAIIVVLAQVGSFVPATAAHIGVCDRVFTRVGAADDLRRGRSTFMVEMSETAAILHHATPRSLVVLDEIGRGTSTFDGLAIAWSVAEDLVDRIRCRAMFATHYHELCELAELRPCVANQSVAVAEIDGEIMFLRRLKEGGASRSYGVQCARIAGLPKAVLTRASALLKRFERRSPSETHQLGLFADAPAATFEPASDPLRLLLEEINPDDLTPRQAHAALYRLRALLGSQDASA